MGRSTVALWAALLLVVVLAVAKNVGPNFNKEKLFKELRKQGAHVTDDQLNKALEATMPSEEESTRLLGSASPIAAASKDAKAAASASRQAVKREEKGEKNANVAKDAALGKAIKVDAALGKAADVKAAASKDAKRDRKRKERADERADKGIVKCYTGPKKRTSKHAPCKTCLRQGQDEAAKRSCTSCHEGFALAAMSFEKVGLKNVATGECRAVPVLEEFVPGHHANCSYSQCWPLQWSAEDKVTCSRTCLLGGMTTRMIGLQRHANSNGTGAVGPVDHKFRGGVGQQYSSPVCLMHKNVLCESAKGYDPEKCEAWKKNNTHPAVAGAAAKHCELRHCEVQKNISCVAILPSTPPKLRGPENKTNTRPVGALGDLTAYTNECKHAVDACAFPVLYI